MIEVRIQIEDGIAKHVLASPVVFDCKSQFGGCKVEVIRVERGIGSRRNGDA